MIGFKNIYVQPLFYPPANSIEQHINLTIHVYLTDIFPKGDQIQPLGDLNTAILYILLQNNFPSFKQSK